MVVTGAVARGVIPLGILVVTWGVTATTTVGGGRSCHITGWVLSLEGLSCHVGGVTEITTIGEGGTATTTVTVGVVAVTLGRGDLTLRSGFPLVLMCDVPNHNFIYLPYIPDTTHFFWDISKAS